MSRENQAHTGRIAQRGGDAVRRRRNKHYFGRYLISAYFIIYVIPFWPLGNLFYV